MTVLSSLLRRRLELSVVGARRAAEGAAGAALVGLGVFEGRRFDYLDAGQASLRVGLRARARQLGDADGSAGLLVAECGYEQWHRLLFARFLAENGLLLHPGHRVPVSLAECEELAGGLGEPDGWGVAARFAAEILPGIFRTDDPCVRLRLAPEGRHALEEALSGIPSEVFTSDDGLGWVYQFWQKERKDEVNRSERKIGGADLGPVTQLFTENYMVRFLLENSLGAWWAARHPDSPLVKSFEYLRFDEEGRPAAGSFEGWPETVAEVTVMDPCCGSGHFLVEAFSMLWRMRAEEEGLGPVEAQDAVLRDNLFGLELDPRCVEIAMMAVALAAWKAGGGWRELPVPNVACSGIPVKAPVEEWTALAGGDPRLENALTRLHILFRDADTLGSLIDPKRAIEITDPTGLQQSFEDVEWDEIAPLLAKATARETADPATAVLGADATSIARAAHYLNHHYTLVTTNVPYLQRGKMAQQLREYCDLRFPQSANDLGLVFLERCAALAGPNEAYAVVVLQYWLFLVTYATLRRRLLETQRWECVARLGPNAFETISGEVVNVMLGVFTKSRPTREHAVALIDAQGRDASGAKAEEVRSGAVARVVQRRQLDNPAHRFLSDSGFSSSVLLRQFAESHVGIQTGDRPRYARCFWETPAIADGWERFVGPPSVTTFFAGRNEVLRWESGHGSLVSGPGAYIRGAGAWGRAGVGIRQTGSLPASLYLGELFDNSTMVITPNDANDLAAVWAFCSSPRFEGAVRSLNTKKSVEAGTLIDVPFDVAFWRKVAEERFPGGLPEPWSDDPTQWLFAGRPEVSTSPLQVGVGRLLGYRWPEQAESDDLDGLADGDGVVCVPSVAGEAPAADRLQRLLAAAFGDDWSAGMVRRLLEESGSAKKSLGEWLRDEFFKQHCAVFGNRPFVWHIWDGLKDGFSALVNYHRLDRKMLEKLTFTYLGTDWVERQRAGVRDEVAGAEARLAAALDLRRRLELILEGEAPYDIFVRWKETHEQPVGWEPDLNDGVRLNIRPFVEAGVLRSKFNIDWRKDRGKNPDGSERHNDIHLTLADKHTARQKAGKT